MGQYMHEEQNGEVLDRCVKYVEKMFLDHGYTVYSTAE